MYDKDSGLVAKVIVISSFKFDMSVSIGADPQSKGLADTLEEHRIMVKSTHYPGVYLVGLENTLI